MQDSTYLCVQVKSDAMPEEPSDDMQEAEKSDDKPEEAKKRKKRSFKEKILTQTQHRRSEHEHETIHQRAHFGAYND